MPAGIRSITGWEQMMVGWLAQTARGEVPDNPPNQMDNAAVDAINITVAESQGSAPNVALYLDEQPVTAGGRSSARRCTVTPSAKSNSSVLAELRICQVQF